jgi:hypothetical protein
MPVFGCVPGNNPYLCWDGSCAASVKDCNPNCNDLQHLCYGIKSCSDNCIEPFTKVQIPRIKVSFEVPPNKTRLYFLYKSNPSSFPSNKNEIMGFVVFINGDGAPPTRMNLTVESPTYHELNEKTVGPLPQWPVFSNYNSLLYTAPIKIYSDTDPSPIPHSKFNLNVQLKYYNDDMRSPLKPPHCFGSIVPWYWHKLDNTSLSPYKELPYIVAYREGKYSETSGPQPPPYRWTCKEDSQTPTQPIPGIESVETVNGLFRSNFTGNVIVNWGIYAIISNPDFPVEPPLSDDTSPQLPIIIGAVIIFAAITVTIIVLHATDDNSPSLKCWK